MILFPAIDLKNGQCVRLYQGDFSKMTVFNNDPANQAKAFEAAGFEWLHMVDLDGALEGKPVNKQAVESVLKQTNIPVQLGGGIRSIQNISSWIELGVNRVILGTVALKNPDFVIEACREFPGRIVVGIDGRKGSVAVHGWSQTSDVTVTELARKFEGAGVSAIVYTDIGRDGTMTGPDLEGTRKLAESISIPVILSGGISNTEDIEKVKKIEKSGIQGIIIGRALYDNKIDIPRALEISKELEQ